MSPTAYFIRFGTPGKRQLDSILNATIPGLFCHSSYMIGEAPRAGYRQEYKFGVLVATLAAATHVKMAVKAMAVSERDEVAIHSIVPVTVDADVHRRVRYGGNHKDRATDAFPWDMFGITSDEPDLPTVQWFEKKGHMTVRPGEQVTEDKFVEGKPPAPHDGRKRVEFRIGRRKVKLLFNSDAYAFRRYQYHPGSDCGRSEGYHQDLAVHEQTTSEPLNKALTDLLNRQFKKPADWGFFERIEFKVFGDGILVSGGAA